MSSSSKLFRLGTALFKLPLGEICVLTFFTLLFCVFLFESALIEKLKIPMSLARSPRLSSPSIKWSALELLNLSYWQEPSFCEWPWLACELRFLDLLAPADLSKDFNRLLWESPLPSANWLSNLQPLPFGELMGDLFDWDDLIGLSLTEMSMASLTTLNSDWLLYFFDSSVYTLESRLSDFEKTSGEIMAACSLFYLCFCCISTSFSVIRLCEIFSTSNAA